MKSRISWLGLLVMTMSCGSPPAPNATAPRPSTSAAGSQSSAAPVAQAPIVQAVAAKPEFGSTPTGIQATYEARLARSPDLTWERLIAQGRISRKPPPQLDFDPTRISYYPEVERALVFTDEERNLYRKNGFVVVDHGQRYSMGSAYFAIYTRDLPVLVTTDSALHALHRSFDAILRELEEGLLSRGFKNALSALSDRLGQLVATTKEPVLLDALGDVDVYLTVATNLLAGAGAKDKPPAPSSDGRPVYDPNGPPDAWDGTLLEPTKTHRDAEALEILKRIRAGVLELPEGPGLANCTPLRGTRHCIDYTQFTPRGHYTKSIALKRYFRAMMWLGRADTGWVLGGGTKENLVAGAGLREARGAALLALLAKDSGQLKSLAALSGVIDLLVGPPDSATLAQLTKALEDVGFKSAAELAADEAVSRVLQALPAEGTGGQTIRSQSVEPAGNGKSATEPPKVLQLAGQRFVVDAFVLSKVVYDSIDYQGKKQERVFPMGLDVMATLGNDEAVHLLKPELERYHYASNLLALRETLVAHGEALFSQNLYGSWLGALKSLHQPPSSGAFPQSMRSTAWERKQLHTQLASWAELRHDTVLYAKQSYTAMTVCEYPDGYVEPYPEFFAKLAALTGAVGQRLGAVLPPEPKGGIALSRVKNAPPGGGPTGLRDVVPISGRAVQGFLNRFAETMRKLEGLARKELSSTPFTPEEQAFLKQTIDIRGGGSGPPRYDGWYPKLFYSEGPAKWEPTVADVHTSPGPLVPGVLEEGVGDANFIAVAVNNGNDRRVYVGPVYSYYELVVPPTERLTDEDWASMLSRDAQVPRPKWTGTFIGKKVRRALGVPAKERE